MSHQDLATSSALLHSEIPQFTTVCGLKADRAAWSPSVLFPSTGAQSFPANEATPGNGEKAGVTVFASIAPLPGLSDTQGRGTISTGSGEFYLSERQVAKPTLRCGFLR